MKAYTTEFKLEVARLVVDQGARLLQKGLDALSKYRQPQT